MKKLFNYFFGQCGLVSGHVTVEEKFFYFKGTGKFFDNKEITEKSGHKTFTCIHCNKTWNERLSYTEMWLHKY